MPYEVRVSPGVMEGNGSYNRHAKLPADGGALALPLLTVAWRSPGRESCSVHALCGGLGPHAQSATTSSRFTRRAATARMPRSS